MPVAGLHLGTTTVGRILKEDPLPSPEDAVPSTRVATADRPNHVWHIDLTAVATSVGFWAPWLPFALPQCWPFCWWVAVVIDHLMCCRRVRVLATNRARDGRVVRHAHRRTNQSPAIVALAFASMSTIIGVGSTCRSLS